jgi:hypothetical protein
MLRPSPLAASPENHLLLRTTSLFNPSNRLPHLSSERFNPVLKPQINHRFLPSLSVSSRRFPFSLASCVSRRFDEAETVKEVTDEGEGEKAEEEVTGVSNVVGKSGFMSVGVGNPSLFGRVGLMRMSLGDQAFFLLAFVAATVCTSPLYDYRNIGICNWCHKFRICGPKSTLVVISFSDCY